MKVKLLLLFIILFLLSLGALSAEDNSTSDNLTEKIEVTFDEQMWHENLSDIDVKLPENASGDFAVKIDDEVIYNRTITEKSFKVPITLPERTHELVVSIWPPIDCRYYKVSAFYNGADLNITTPLKIMKYSPDYNMLHFPQEILQGDKYSTLLAFPRSANGIVEFYIDDELLNRTTSRPTVYFSDNPFSGLSLGDHTFRVVYHGDSYYHPYNRTFNFTVTNVVISIPEVINIGHDDCISVKTQENINGNVKVYLDDKLIVNSNTDNGEFIMSLEGYLKYTNREIKVIYTSKDFSRTKIQSVNMSYDLEVWTDHFTYGNQNILEIYLPDTLNNNLLKTTINGQTYQFKRSTTVNNIVEIDISNLRAGTYTLFMSYSGDVKYYALNKTCNFTIDYSISITYYFHFESDSKVYLKLPGDAQGDLVVYADGKHFKSVKLRGGYAEINIASLNLGYHDILAQYSGSDYAVKNQSEKVYIAAKITYQWEFTAGDNQYITVKVPSQSKGYVIFEIDEKQYRINVKDGIAKLSLKNLKVGDYEVNIEYHGEDGFTDLDNWAELSVIAPKIKFISFKANFKGINVKMKLLTQNGKALANKVVTVKFNGKTYKIKTNKKGIMTFKKSMKLKNKKYSLKIEYMGFKLTKKIKAVPIILKVSKTKKKLVIKVTISKKVKNKVVSVKINSKKYLIKTNKNGVAGLTVKKPKTIKSISATYLKNTVKI